MQSKSRSRRQPAQRLVVADLSLLQGRNQEYRIPDGVGLVIPGILIDEITGKFETDTDDDARGQAGKLFDLFSKNPGRVFIGRNVGELDLLERNPDVRLDSRHWIHHDLSERLWFDLPSREVFVQRASEVRGLFSPTHVALGREEFSRMREEWRLFSERHLGDRANSFRGSTAAHAEWARHPARVARTADSNPRFASGPWAQALLRYPDRYAWPRWIRLAAWYGLQGFLNPETGEAKFTNDWADAQYVILASFAGELASADGRMRRAAQAVFDHVVVKSALPS